MEQTQEEILTDAFYGRETTADSGINEEEQSDDAPESTEVDEETTEEVGEDGTDSEPEQKKEEEPKKKSNSNFAKLLAERNSLKRQLAEKLGSYDSDSIQDISKLAQEQAERIVEEKLFFRDNPKAKDIADEIKSVASEHNMDIETAYKFYTSVLDPQSVAKSESKKLGVSGIANRSVNKSKDPYDKASLDAINKQYAAEINGMY